MKIGITGASGQIGRSLLKALLKEGHEVHVLIHRHSKELKDLPIQIFKGSTTAADSLEPWIQGCEAVYHLAAIVSINGDPDGRVWKTNVEGSRNVLDACVRHGIKRLVHFSSVHAFNPHPVQEALDENRPLVGSSGFVYERSKAAAQQLVQQYVREKGLAAIILNPTAVLGPEDALPSIKGKMLIDFYRGNIPVLTPGGYDWVDTRDVVQAAVNALHRGKIGEAHLLAGKYYTIVELAKMIESVLGKKMPDLVMPMFLLRLFVPFIKMHAAVLDKEPLYTGESLRALEQGNRQISTLKARQELGFQTRPLEDTLRDSYKWFKQNGYLN